MGEGKKKVEGAKKPINKNKNGERLENTRARKISEKNCMRRTGAIWAGCMESERQKEGGNLGRGRGFETSVKR